MKQDRIKIEILEDGTIKVTTDPISGPNHVNAEGFLRQMASLAGGETKRARRLTGLSSQKVKDALNDHTADGHAHDGDEHDHAF